MKLYLIALYILSFPLQAQTTSLPPKPHQDPLRKPLSQVERVGGLFKVRSIDKLPNHKGFKVVFESASGGVKYKTIVLESENLNFKFDLYKSDKPVRMSAEVAEIEGDTVFASQVVVFLPSAAGQIPIWMISNRIPVKNHDTPARYLEMNVPDFIVL